MRLLPLILFTCALLTQFSPGVVAHFPPGPVLYCQPESERLYHDYLPPAGHLIRAQTNLLEPEPRVVASAPLDGNLADCWKPNNIEVGDLETGLPRPLADYDGEPEFNIGSARLFFDTGWGWNTGVLACYGWPSVGHHTGAVYAFDSYSAFGPAFFLGADYSRPGLEEEPDCGDGVMEPCIENPPQSTAKPFPHNLVVEAINDAIYEAFGPSGEGCNPSDSIAFAEPNDYGPSHLNVPFAPGVDGSVYVHILAVDHRIPLGGHVWTL